MASVNFDNFGRGRRNVTPVAAIEATSTYIPFQDEAHLDNNGGMSDKCFFLKDKTSGEIFEWNEAMARDGRSFYLPEYDTRLLSRPEYKGYRDTLVSSQRIMMVELNNLLLPSVRAGVADVVAKQIEDGDVNADNLNLDSLPDVQKDSSVANPEISKVLEAAKRGRKPKDLMAA